ncbi:Cytoskeleton-associated protein 5 [Zancudomyces culisetae]|uniref:Cytoskeleton-associated protein 5 n=1 Tax=Zancudomyces culisetae TaxID=1213189 RepID=A0A1R1PSQ0_ZANCU|nr:Cytoskeleton-associated protein 5 [Zancudomyces culisetae]|eukprot:OMH83988.1 Cytoskeleton-associated protein 5 [Zancudomyces culisetae]
MSGGERGERGGSSASGSRETLLLGQQSQQSQQPPPITSTDPRIKEMRAKREMINISNTSGSTSRWQFSESPRPELVTYLHEQMNMHFSSQLINLLFSQGHYRDRDYVNGLAQLDEFITKPGSVSLMKYGVDSGYVAESVAANVDLLFKYISVRLYDTQPTTVLKSLELLSNIFEMMLLSNNNNNNNNKNNKTEGEGEGENEELMTIERMFSDYEMHLLVPHLINRFGDAKEAVRTKVKTLVLKVITKLYPPSKLFNMIAEYGIKNNSRNARMRQESLDALTCLKLSVICQQLNKLVPLIAQQIKDRDNSVRVASLNCLVAIGIQLNNNNNNNNSYGGGGGGGGGGGEVELWKLIGPIAEKEKIMLQERIKRSELSSNNTAFTFTSTSGSGSGGSGGGNNIQSVESIGKKSFLMTKQNSNNSIKQVLPTPTTPKSTLKKPIISNRFANTNTNTSSGSGNIGNEMMLDSLVLPSFSGKTSNEIYNRASPFSKLKRLEKPILNDYNNHHSNENDMQIDDQLLSTTTTSNNNNNNYNNNNNNNSGIGSGSGNAVTLEFDELLNRLEENIQNMSSNEYITTLERVLHLVNNARYALPTSMYIVSINLFQEAVRNPLLVSNLQNITGGQGQSLGQGQGKNHGNIKKYIDVLQRCLWRLVKRVPQDIIQQLDIAKVFCKIEEFFGVVSESQWVVRRDESVYVFGDAPMRTIKSLLHALVVVLQASSWNHISNVMVYLSNTNTNTNTNININININIDNGIDIDNQQGMVLINQLVSCSVVIAYIHRYTRSQPSLQQWKRIQQQVSNFNSNSYNDNSGTSISNGLLVGKINDENITSRVEQLEIGNFPIGRTLYTTSNTASSTTSSTTASANTSHTIASCIVTPNTPLHPIPTTTGRVYSINGRNIILQNLISQINNSPRNSPNLTFSLNPAGWLRNHINPSSNDVIVYPPINSSDTFTTVSA